MGDPIDVTNIPQQNISPEELSEKYKDVSIFVNNNSIKKPKTTYINSKNSNNESSISNSNNNNSISFDKRENIDNMSNVNINKNSNVIINNVIDNSSERVSQPHISVIRPVHHTFLYCRCFRCYYCGHCCNNISNHCCSNKCIKNCCCCCCMMCSDLCKKCGLGFSFSCCSRCNCNGFDKVLLGCCEGFCDSLCRACSGALCNIY